MNVNQFLNRLEFNNDYKWYKTLLDTESKILEVRNLLFEGNEISKEIISLCDKLNSVLDEVKEQLEELSNKKYNN